MKNKFIGNAMIIVGTEIGAGMLALPMVSAMVGFWTAALLTIAIYVLMTTTALLLLEVNLAFPPQKNNFGTMARKTLGRSGEIVAWLTCLILLYALTAAYIAGDASLLTNLSANLFGWHLPNWLSAIIFVLVLGGAVFWSTAAVDYCNRILLSTKGLLLIGALILLMPHINWLNFNSSAATLKYVLAAAPIFLCSFGFQTVIPSITNHLRQPQLLRTIIITGTTTALIIYLLWLALTLGTVPLQGPMSFMNLAQNQGSVGEFMTMITKIANNHWVALGINGFANIAMTTSFLGVTLGLFDFLADGFKRKDNRWGRLQTALLTFVPPMAFALFYPQGFVIALGYAAICVAILEIILPSLMLYKLRRHQKLQSTYRLNINNVGLLLIIFLGITIIAIQILASIHFLPTLH